MRRVALDQPSLRALLMQVGILPCFLCCHFAGGLIANNCFHHVNINICLLYLVPTFRSPSPFGNPSGWPYS